MEAFFLWFFMHALINWYNYCQLIRNDYKRFITQPVGRPSVVTVI